MLGAKAHAAIHGRDYVASEDIHAVAHPVLRHRIITNFQADAFGAARRTQAKKPKRARKPKAAKSS